MIPIRFALGLSCSMVIVAVLYPITCYAQEPVTKPLGTTAAPRLPAPGSVSARQLPDGRIEVRWSPVEGATKYQITRSVPPEPAQVLSSTPVEPLFVDAAVQVGRSYYYVIGAYNEGGVVGLKAGTSVRATLPLGDTGLRAELVSPNRVRLNWIPPPLYGFSSLRVQRQLTTATGLKMDFIGSVSLTPTSFENTFDARGATQVLYSLIPEGRSTPIMASNSLSLDPDPDPSPTTETAGGGSSTALAVVTETRSTTVTVGPSVSLRVGAGSSIATVGGAGARWMSMNDSVASVDSGGHIIARAAGTTQVVALTAGADGSLRVASVAVTVVP